jgi:hypothetical protein
MSEKQELMNRASELVRHAYVTGWAGGIAHIRGTSHSDLLQRFAELYGEVPLTRERIEPGRKLWRDYYESTGEHMILTDEGWEPGEVKESYIDEIGPEAILDEVNCPDQKERKG